MDITRQSTNGQSSTDEKQEHATKAPSHHQNYKQVSHPDINKGNPSIAHHPQA